MPEQTGSRGNRSSRGSGGGQRRGARPRRGGRGARQAEPADPAAQHVAAAARAAKEEAGVVSAAAAAAHRATTTTTTTTQTAADENQDDDDDDDVNVCFICANPVAHHSIAPCNHTTCHICGLRMRALYKTKDCAHCRTEAPFVIFSNDPDKRFQDYKDTDLTTIDSNIGIKYTNEDIVGDTVLLLRYNCPDVSCDFAGLGWPDLHRHVKTTHRKRMCDLCTRNKKVFTHEHELFSDRELEKHMRRGDDKPGAADQTGFKGHPLCAFCGERFYDDDKLYEHCRMKHERCFICDRRDSRKPHYFVDYNALEQHFGNDHFLCADRECMEKKFVVFESKMDLQAHTLAEHAAGKTVGRDARVVDMSGFDLRQSYQHERRRGAGAGAGGAGGARGGGRSSGRGRDPNQESVPFVHTQPLRRDEIAFQRQMAVHSAQSVSQRTFGGQLSAPTPVTTTTTSAGRSGGGGGTSPSGGSSTSTPKVGPSSGNNSNNNNNSNINNVADGFEMISLSDTTANMTLEERARVVRHASVIERAANLLGNDGSKLSRFRQDISAYQRGTMTAGQLIEAFFALFAEVSSNALGTMTREVAELFESRAKAEDLRKAWRDWRAIHDDYPSLPAGGQLATSSSSGGSSGWAATVAATSSLSSSLVGGGGVPAAQQQKQSNRVLRLKNSTRLAGPTTPMAATGQTSSTPPGGWTAAAAGGSRIAPAPAPLTSLSSSSSSSAAFPSLAASSGSAASRPSWVAASSQAAAARATEAPRTSSSSGGSGSGSGGRSRNGGGGRSEDAFPALPAAPKPTTTIFGYGGGGGGGRRGVRRDFGRVESSFQWGGAADGEGSRAGGGGGGGEGEGEEGKGKKGKKGKKVLVQWG